ncbi:MAG TPA: HAMP domain-containing sensor histidine kinase [Acidimicrobiales bacterium]|nr:HAMP domain-containing sensor histidine kinase [Acidimicrobiales bacterium]
MRSGQRSTNVYRGADRRSRQAQAAPALTVKELFQQAALLPAAAVIPLAVVLMRGVTPLATANALQVLGALAAVVAGAAMLVCWKIGGRAGPGWLGVALVNLGLLSETYYSLALVGLGRLGPVEPYGRLVVCVVVAAVAVAALRSPEVDSSFRPVRVMAATVLIGVCGLGLLERTLPESYAQGGGTGVQAGTTAASAVVWLAIGLYTVLGRKPSFTRTWVGCFSLVLAAGSGVAAVIASSPWRPVVNQTGYLLAAAFALVGSASELRSTVQGQDRFAFSLRRNLNDMRSQMETERAELEERLHDLRNAVAAMRSAHSTLQNYQHRLDEETRNMLADAFSSELSRLQTLIEPGRRMRSEEFCLARALQPVLATERTWGAALEVHIEPVAVRGDPQGVAQVVQNLLTNARLYAPGSPVSVTAERLADRVIVRVADCGPGIPEGERLTVFGRGARGSTSAGTSGSGIGLFVASRLMAEMGGALRLADSGDPSGRPGACFVLELPAAGTDPRVKEPVQEPAPAPGLPVISFPQN